MRPRRSGNGTARVLGTGGRRGEATGRTSVPPGVGGGEVARSCSPRRRRASQAEPIAFANLEKLIGGA